MSGIIAYSEYSSNKAATSAKEGQESAARATTEATEKNIDFQKWLWGEQKELKQPWVTAGGDALGKSKHMMNSGFGYEQYNEPRT